MLSFSCCGVIPASTWFNPVCHMFLFKSPLGVNNFDLVVQSPFYVLVSLVHSLAVSGLKLESDVLTLGIEEHLLSLLLPHGGLSILNNGGVTFSHLGKWYVPAGVL